ncbi:MAG: choice-of-anchor tandem repeat GloVer-containing protein [Candidatus Cybelea sp.]
MRPATFAPFLGVAIAFSGCARSTTPIVPARLVPSRAASLLRPASNFKVLHSFGSEKDGKNPEGSMKVFKGALYGTTYGGGAFGIGTVFAIGAAGAERVLRSFDYSDGARPTANLIGRDGILYGTTSTGGQHGMGTVFTLSSSGRQRVLYNFKGGPNGDQPLAGLTFLNGTLYGTTYGGAYYYFRQNGTAFSITTAGRQRVLHKFGIGSGYDGFNPEGDLTVLNSTLYGTTYSGGANYDGTVYSLTTGGHESVIYTFTGGNGDGDGSQPQAGLVTLNGMLYGTTSEGGTGDPPIGCGTVFSVTPAGEEKIVYNFQCGADGADPIAGLTVVNGMLYGTTQYGGGTGCQSSGCGTIFSVSTSGTERIVHAFKGGATGAYPAAALTLFNGKLYGTTESGGTKNAGTVFALSP